jgi:hypothetical protein
MWERFTGLPRYLKLFKNRVSTFKGLSAHICFIPRTPLTARLISYDISSTSESMKQPFISFPCIPRKSVQFHVGDLIYSKCPTHSFSLLSSYVPGAYFSTDIIHDILLFRNSLLHHIFSLNGFAF